MAKTYPSVRVLEYRRVFLRWCLAGLVAVILGLASVLTFYPLADLLSVHLVSILAAFLTIMLLSAVVSLSRTKSRLQNYHTAEQNIAAAILARSSSIIRDLQRRLRDAAARDPIIDGLVASKLSSIELRLQEVLDVEASEQRRKNILAKCASARKALADRLEAQRHASPAIRAERELLEAIRQLKELKANAKKQLEERRNRLWLKWWFDLVRPSFDEVDARIKALQVAKQKLEDSGDIAKTQAYFRTLNVRASFRLRQIEQVTSSAIPLRHADPFDEDRVLKNALLLSALSVPISVWRDISKASSVYDSLRQVNQNYAGMSDTEIWFDTLTMSRPELAGLANLTKGALFENYVAADTGGQLHEHFNHPDTDIVIDGVAYQIKATDSGSYIDSVSEGVPVISTTEVAEMTGAIDGGYTNEELTQAVELALGGTVLDFSDTAMDAVLGGVGGVGIFAIISGARSGLSKYKESGEAVDALFVAIGATATVTARSAVNLAEIVTKVTLGAGRLIGLGKRKSGQ